MLDTFRNTESSDGCPRLFTIWRICLTLAVLRYTATFDYVHDGGMMMMMIEMIGDTLMMEVHGLHQVRQIYLFALQFITKIFILVFQSFCCFVFFCAAPFLFLELMHGYPCNISWLFSFFCPGSLL